MEEIYQEKFGIYGEESAVSMPTYTMAGQTSMSYGPMNSSWPMYCHDVKHTSRSSYSTANNPYVEKWRFHTLNHLWIGTSMTISNDGTIYFGQSNHMYALYSNGTLKWTYPTWEITISSTPTIDENGTIYLGTWGCTLWAFNPDGTLKWKRTGLGSSIASSPAIGSDGTIYFGTLRDNGQIIAMDPNGHLKWQYFTGRSIASSPAIGDDGTIYIGSEDDCVYAMYPNGTLRWRFKTGDQIQSDPSIAPDGTIYITSYDGYLYALYSNGTLRWKTHMGGSISNSAIASDGTIYAGGDHLYAVYPNGTMRWVFNLGTDRWIGRCSPAISADGTIYVGVMIGDGAGGEILAVNPDGTEHWRKLIADQGFDTSPAIGSDGTIYFTAEQDKSGDLVAIGRGPLLVNVNGPYTGYYQLPLQFTGTIFGGIPPYSCHWDFGDGQTSDAQNPTHSYMALGNYAATLTATDSEGNSSSDTALVTITYSPPIITKPVNAIYIMNMKIINFDIPLVFGTITVAVTMQQDPSEIDRVEFTVDGKLRATDTRVPYRWTWRLPSFNPHILDVTAYFKSGETSSTRLTVYKYF
jgi:outer membrane protein assembly factor BamB